MAKNWIITAQGEAINLDYVSKVMWGGNFATPKPTWLYIIHGGVAGGAGVSGANTAYEYTNAKLAQAAQSRIISLLSDLGMATDLRTPTAALTALTPNTSAAGASTLISLTGSGFQAGGTITINGVDMAVSISGGVAQFTTDASLTAGTYDVIYTDSYGNAATLANGITIT